MTKNTQTTKKARASRATKRAPRKSAKATKTTKTTRAKKPRAKATRKAPAAPAEKPKQPRDPRLPAPGTEIVRPYKGRDIRVAVLEEGFRWEGEEYRSLSALARKVTGAASINGFLFFKLTEPKAKPAAAEPTAS